MLLVRFGAAGSEKPGLLDSRGDIRSLSSLVDDISPSSLANGLLGHIRAVDAESLPRVPGRPRLGAPIARPGKIVCVGLNYRAHAEESRMEPPSEPVLFMKATTAVTGPTDPVLLPRGWSKVDWEVELAAIIGHTARNVPLESALEFVAGYCLSNDVSERAFQLERGGQWVKGKSCDSFAPLGPWFVTADEMPDVQDLDLWLDLNDGRMQSGNTRQM